MGVHQEERGREDVWGRRTTIHKAQRRGSALRSRENTQGRAREGGRAGEEVARWAGAATRAWGAFLRNVRFLL